MTKLYRDRKIISNWEIKSGEKVKKGHFVLTIATCRHGDVSNIIIFTFL